MMKQLIKSIVFLLLITLGNTFAQEIKPAVQHGHFKEVTYLLLNEEQHIIQSYSVDQQAITWDLKTGMMVSAKNSFGENQAQQVSQNAILQNDTLYKITGPLLTITVNNKVVASKTTTYFDLGYTSFIIQKNNPYLFAASQDGQIYVYEKQNLRLVKHLRDHNSAVLCLQMSADGNFLYSSGQDRSIIEWNAKDLVLKRRFYGHSHRITSLAFSNSGDTLYFGNETGQLKAFSFASYSNELDLISISNFELSNIQTRKSTNEEELIITSLDNRIYNFKTTNKKQSTLSKYHRLSIRHTKHFLFERLLNRYTHSGIDDFVTDYNTQTNSIVFAANEPNNRKRRKIVVKDFDRFGRIAIKSDYDRFKNVCIINDTLLAIHRENNVDDMSAHQDAELTLWKIKGRKRSKYDTPFSMVQTIAAYKGTYLYVATASGLTSWNITKNEQQETLNSFFNKLIVQDDYLIGITNNLATVYKIGENGSLSSFATLTGHTHVINDVVINQKRGIIATASDDATIRFFTLNGNHIGTLVPTGQKDFILLSSNNTYQITKNAYKKFGFSSGTNFIFPDQFDLMYNKPHEVLGALNIGTVEEVLLLEKAYQKRIKRMGMGEISLQKFTNLPEISIEDYQLIGDSTLLININAQDDDYKLDRINVYVNNVAVFGSKGYQLNDKNEHIWKGEIKIPLLNGKNNVEISLLNSNGVESIRKSLRCEAKSIKKPDLYLIAFGASKYQDSTRNLSYPHKDAGDIAKLFSQNKNIGYAKINTHVVINESVTKNSLSGCRQFLSKAKSNDIVIIFYAGHGVLDKNFDYFLATHDIDFLNPNEKGIAYEELEALLDGIAPLRKALFIDACHSGELDKDDVVAITNETEDVEGIKFRTVGSAVKEKAIGVTKTNSLVRELFTDLRKGTGATVISSAGGMEFAQESGQWKNGLFTYCMLEGMRSKSADMNKDGTIMLSELQQYVSSRVTKLSKGMQQPTSRFENDALDWIIW